MKIPKGLLQGVVDISENIISKLRNLLDTFNSNDIEFECEIRLGHVVFNKNGTPKFQSGVDKNFFTRR